jgi:hypothetical protein
MFGLDLKSVIFGVIFALIIWPFMQSLFLRATARPVT